MSDHGDKRTEPKEVFAEAPVETTERKPANLEESLEAAKAKFSEAEIQQFITMGKALAGRAVCGLLEKYVLSGDDNGERSKIIAKLRNVSPKEVGKVEIEFEEPELADELRLIICLSLVENKYKTDIVVPNAKYQKDLYEQYNFLKGIALAYYRQFAETHKALFERIKKFLPEMDLNELVVDPDSPTTMFIESEFQHRIGILAFYVGKDGKPFAHRK